MGSTKTETRTESRPTPTAEETEMNKLRLQQFREVVGPQTELQLQGMDLIRQLFGGSTELPGFFGQISELLKRKFYSRRKLHKESALSH